MSDIDKKTRYIESLIYTYFSCIDKIFLMRKIIFSLVGAMMVVLLYPRVFSFVYRLVPAKWWNARIAYGQVRDICDPKIEDYQALQKFLARARRPALARLGDMEKRARHFCLIGKKAEELPQFGKVAVNCSEDEKENCLIIYASFNKAYPQGLKRLVDYVSNSDFKGHILYRIGGWPNVEEGDLKLAHVPYAFKPCFFREALQLGYRRVLWLDASIQPIVSLNRIFEEIAAKGYFAVGNGQYVAPFINEQAAASLGVTLGECAKIPSVSAGLFGVDFSDEKAALAIAKWHQAAQDSAAFFSSRPEQNALSIILFQMDMQNWASSSKIAESSEPISQNTYFKIDRGYVQYDK